VAGQATDIWTRSYRVAFATADGPHTVVVTEEGDGVNQPSVSATLDGQPVEVTVTGSVAIDGITELVDVADDGDFLAHVEDCHILVYRSLGEDEGEGDVPDDQLSSDAILHGRRQHANEHAAGGHDHTHPEAELGLANP
jgi:hypothetical protein